MVFRDREDGGRQLAEKLAENANRDDVLVLGIPRGGVPVAFQIAISLNSPLDVFLARKLGVPGQEEFAFGALAAGDGRFVDQNIIKAVGLSEEEIDRITAETAATLDERARLYREDRKPLPIEGRLVILVDDGIATGASIYAAISALRQTKPQKIVLAAPVAPASACKWLPSIVDEMVVIHRPHRFYAVGQYYSCFTQVSDDEVIRLLHESDRQFHLSGETCGEQAETISHSNSSSPREVSAPAGDKTLRGRRENGSEITLG